MATFYTLLRYLYSEEQGQSYSAGVLPATSGSEFREAIAGKDIEKVVDVLDEHMEVVMLLFPKEYKEVIRRISEEGQNLPHFLLYFTREIKKFKNNKKSY